MKALSESMTATSLRKPKQRPTISDVARLAGVSISTVSRVLNDTAPVSDDVDKRVRQAVELLSYTPHAAARNLAVRRTNTVGLLLPELSSGFFAPILRGIESALRESEYHLLVHASLRSADTDPWRRHPIGEHNADGMLLFVNSTDDEDILRNYQRDFPMVLLFFKGPRGVDIPYVGFDNAGGIYQIVEHLVMVHGRRRIVYLRGPVGNQDSDEREVAYRQSLAQLGLPFDPALVARGGYSDQGGQAAIEQLIASGVDFDAVFTGDDEAATGVLAALRAAGRRIPEDVAVIGFDDLTFAAHLNPPLTTARAPIEQAGHLAGTILLSILHGEVPEPAPPLHVELVIRRSCGCQG